MRICAVEQHDGRPGLVVPGDDAAHLALLHGFASLGFLGAAIWHGPDQPDESRAGRRAMNDLNTCPGARSRYDCSMGATARAQAPSRLRVPVEDSLVK